MIKWLDGCEKVEDVIELLAIDPIMKMMPRPIANHVQDRCPKKLDEATAIADDFVRTRGLNYDKPSDWSSQERHSKKHNHRDGRPRTNPTSGTSQQPPLKPGTEEKLNKDFLTGNCKKKVEPKYFDTERGPMCFRCHEWGHKGKECSQNICAVAGCQDVVNTKRWNDLAGCVRTNECDIVLNSGADTSVVVKDLVPDDAYTGEYKIIAGVHAVARRVPVARILVTLDNRKFWVKAAVLDSAPQDLLLGADCEEQLKLFQEATHQA